MPAIMRALRLFAAGALFVLAAPLAAQEDPPATPVTYEVEILVFRNLDASGSTAETPAPTGTIDAGVAPPLSFDARPDYPALPAGALQLAGAAGQMRRSGRYRPLLHAGWSQPVSSQAATIAVPLPPEAAQAGLQGSVTLFRERFLHLAVKLYLTEPEANPAATARIVQSRRVRGRNWQYFDHPRFGAIVSVRAPPAVEANTPEPDADGGPPTD